MTMECWSFPPRYDDSYTPPAGSRYWFPKRETMDAGERDRAILGRLQEVCHYAYASSVSAQESLGRRRLSSQPVEVAGRL